VGRTGDNLDTQSLAFDPLGTLFGVKGTSPQISNLITINTTNGSGSPVGSTGATGLLALAMRTDSVVVSVGEQSTGDMPKTYSLAQNFPNPFNPATTIRFALPQQSQVTISVYNVLGQQVGRLLDVALPAGFHEVRWTAQNATGAPVASGIYFYRMDATGASGDHFSSVKKMLVLR